MTTDNRNIKKTNKNDYISNIPETPKDATQDDLLNSEYFTDGLVDYIEHADSPLSISLNGEWGSGKTSIMNTIKNRLCEGDNAKFHGIWVNTWQFSLLDSSPAPQAVVRILQSIVNQILRLKPDYDRRKQISQLISTLATISSGLKSFSDAAGDPLFGVGKSTFGLAEKASNALNKLFSTKLNQSQTDNAALIKQLSDEVQKLVDEVLTVPDTKKSQQEDHVAKYEPYNPLLISKIPNCICAKFVYFVYFCLCNLATMLVFIVYYLGIMVFNVIFNFIGGTVLSVVKSLPIVKTLFDFCCYVIRVGDAIFCNKERPKNSKKDGFVFFIDDLDRIDPNVALEIVEMLANVFSIEKCIFILAIDRDALIKATKLKLSKRELDANDIQCKKYLNRLIHVSVAIPEELYDIQPFLRESLINISFFTPSELDEGGLIYLLDLVVHCSIGKNPRSIKQLINSLSLIGLFKRHAWDNSKKENIPWQVDTITKEMIFIIQCIDFNYPNLCIALSARPYFKTWDLNFAFKYFNGSNKQYTIKLAKQCNASRDWEYALFHICKFNEHSTSEFDNIRSVFNIIDDVFRKFIYKNNANQSEQVVYNKVISNVFLHFYRLAGFEAGGKIYQSHFVKTIKNNCID